MQKRNWEYILLGGICAVYLGVTIYHLRALPGEWYGDISIEHREVLSILAGHWPWRFNLSAGPAYHYVVAAFAYFLGAQYATYKIASVVTGLAVVLMTYLMGKELGGKWAGLLAAFSGAVSFWLLVFARLGSSPQILSPVLSAGAVYFLARFTRQRSWWNLVLSMAFAGIGLFTYPSTFVLPLVVLAVIGWHLVFTTPRMLWVRALVLVVVVMVPFLLWFGATARENPAFSQSGYVGSKVLEPGVPPEKVLVTFGKNMAKALGMFQWTGDNAFRTNVSGKPLLDPLSGALMDIGLVWLFFKPCLRRRWAYVIAPVVILLMPSADPGLPAVEIPSASRSLGAAPFVFLLMGLGLEAALNGAGAIAREGKRGLILAGLIAGVLIVGMGYWNINKYFGPYAWGLPEHNQPWGLEIARYIDRLPADTLVKLEGCCWGEWGDPDPESVYYVLERPQGRQDLLSGSRIDRCNDVLPGRAYALIFPPNPRSALVNTFQRCFPNAPGEMHYDGLGKPAFYTVMLQQGSNSIP